MSLVSSLISLQLSACSSPGEAVLRCMGLPGPGEASLSSCNRVATFQITGCRLTVQQ